MANESSVAEFIIMQFSEHRDLQILHFLVALILYLAIVTGNLLIISAVILDHHLHKPMYFFVMNLAMQDIGSVSVVIPKSMANSLLNTRRISYSGCVAQVLLFIFFLASDFSLLTVMAYDRYVAICNPLYYEFVMNRRACVKMVVIAWITGLAYGMLHTCGTFVLPFCSNVVKQFFCEIPQLIMLVCSGKNLIENVALVFSFTIGLGCFLFVAVTYVHIFLAVLTLPSVQGRQKAFSTCLPHIFVFATYLCTGSFATFSPIFSTSSHLDLLFAMIYSVVPPLLNPVIYSMRSKEIKAALSKLLGFRHSSKNIIFTFLQ